MSIPFTKSEIYLNSERGEPVSTPKNDKIVNQPGYKIFSPTPIIVTDFAN
jgi:hypothetical protein